MKNGAACARAAPPRALRPTGRAPATAAHLPTKREGTPKPQAPAESEEHPHGVKERLLALEQKGQKVTSYHFDALHLENLKPCSPHAPHGPGERTEMRVGCLLAVCTAWMCAVAPAGAWVQPPTTFIPSWRNTRCRTHLPPGVIARPRTGVLTHQGLKTRTRVVAYSTAMPPPRVMTPKRQMVPPDTRKSTAGGGGAKFSVILFNDPVNTKEHVARCLMVQAGLSEGEAFECMMQAHQSGMGVVGTYFREIAEHHTTQLTQEGLTVSMVPAPDGGG